MWTVEYKSHHTGQAWARLGNYGSEQSALNNASRASGKYLMVRVTNPSGAVVWSG